MTTTTDPAVTVEADGTIVDLIAVRFGDAAIVECTPTGDLVAYAETWDRDSLIVPTTRIRLLHAHDRAHPLGWLTEFHVDDVGLHARGNLVGGSANLDHVRELVAAGLLADASIGFAADQSADQWSPPERRNGLARVLRRRARIREVSLVDQAAVGGSRVVAITTPRPGPSASTTSALAEADAAVRGSGYVARQRVDHQAQAALALAEADELSAAGQRWTYLDHADDDTEPAPAPAPAPAAQTWQERLDDERERLWLAGREDDARREYFETVARRQRAEEYLHRQANR